VIKEKKINYIFVMGGYNKKRGVKLVMGRTEVNICMHLDP
jgi:hypothetical protein